MMTLTVSEISPNCYNIMKDGKIIDRLTCDEALGVVAMVLLNGTRPNYGGGFKTIEELQCEAVGRGWPKPQQPEPEEMQP